MGWALGGAAGFFGAMALWETYERITGPDYDVLVAIPILPPTWAVFAVGFVSYVPHLVLTGREFFRVVAPATKL